MVINTDVCSEVQCVDEAEEVDAEEAKRDRMVDRVVVYTVQGGSIFKE